MTFFRISFAGTLIFFVVTLIVSFGLSHGVLYGETLSPKISGDRIIFENNFVSYAIGTDGLNKSFVDKRTGKDYLDNNFKTNFMSIDLGQRYTAASKIEYVNNYLLLTFGATKIRARIHVRILPEYITFEIISISDQSVLEFQLANLPLTCTESKGTNLTCTRDKNYAGCIIPLNMEIGSKVQVNAMREASAQGPSGLSVDVVKITKQEKISSNSLIAWCERNLRLTGSKVAVIGCPSDNLLNIIEQVEIENGLPHPTIGGVWARKSKEVRQSYLFTDYSEGTVDEVIDYARTGGFGYITIYDGLWNSTHGTYLINEKNFPGGEAGLKKAVKKIHDAGLKAGVHNMNGLLSRNDPLVHPVPHPGLSKRKENERTLERDIDALETFIPITTSPKGLLEKSGKSLTDNRDIQIDNEIITYDDIQATPPYGFVGCKRGAYGTISARHQKESKIQNIGECWGFFEPDIESDLGDIVSRNLAGAMDNIEFDMIYPENVSGSGYGPSWYLANVIVNKLYNYTKREILWAHEPASNWAWHVLARGNTTDFVTRGIIEHFDIASIDNSRRFAADLQPFEFGWFGFFGKEIDRDATIPREVEYAYSKTCAYNGAMSIETNLDALRANGRTKEMFAIMKNWEDLKLENYFSKNAIEKLQQKGKEFTLDKDSQGNWVARQIVYGPEKYIGNLDGKDNAWSFENTFSSQPFRVLIKSMPRLADYGDRENKVLIKPGELNFATSVQGPMGGGRNSEGTSFKMTNSTEQVKIGDMSFKVVATNNSEKPDGWGCAEIIMDQIHDMTKNRAVGTWVYGDGSGVPLHFVVEDAGRWVVRDWWVKLDFKGWKYVLIPEPAKGEVYGFNYPYSSYWPIRHINYSKMARVYVFLTNIAPQQSVSCYFTQLEALREKPSIIKNPKITVGAQAIMFPVTLSTEDYLEFEGSSRFRAFNSEGKTIADNNIQTQAPVLNGGNNQVGFQCDFTAPQEQAAKVEIITLGEPLK